ncbi:restriction endonuclease subunit S [Vibrio furnissii]|uniref:restriction endonuclease subunit S n=1 Tax=Vibrio furnissii TaxID=29494 RepID=UPI0025723C94|nr:restriction endonuclease subunit S [Vibrio furnissii]WJG22304.1 restriction endonuclease subunit S [Vibrio furnissii]
MGKYQAYPEYNHSGNEFVGVLPARWERCTVGSVSNVIDPQPDHRAPEICSDGEGFPYIGIRDVNRDGTLNFDTARPVKESAVIKQEKSFSIEPNDIIFCKVGTLGLPRKIVPHGRCALSATLVLIKTKPNFISQFLLYALDSCVVTSQTDYLATGSTRAALGIQQIRRFQIPKPTVAEQTQIANFLDHETAKIDTLIEKQQQLIKLLKEKRQAVISHAVTKGLNPQAPMKDSGVEWLGEVPEHWVVSRLGFHTLKIGSGKTPKGGAEVYQKEGVLFLRSQNVYDDGLRISESESVYISESIHDEMRTTKVFGGDILLNITGGSIGRTCLVPLEFIEANVNQHVCIIRLPDCLREFISMVLKSTPIKEQIGAIQTGGNREGLNFEQISKFSFALPPESERYEIVQSVKISLAKLDALAEQSNRAIKLMQERRTALISAAVTGKIDVRNWQAPTHQDQALEQTA